jgi:putative ABC transport system permease protein
MGLLFAIIITRLTVALMPDFYVPNEARIEINGYVLVFCVAISMLTAIAFGLVPALQSTRTDLNEILKDEGRGSSQARGGRFRAGLVVTEVAVAIVLLVCASLTMRSFLALQRVDPGFRPGNVVALDLMLPEKQYSTLDQRNRFSGELLERVEALPGVEAAQIGTGGAPFGGPESPYRINGQRGPESQPITVNLVSADYLKTLGIDLRRGRMLSREEVRRADRFAVINEAAAKLWPDGEDPIGKRIDLELLERVPGQVRLATNGPPQLTVVGICADTRNNGLTSEVRPAILMPYTLVAPLGRTLVIRSRNDPATIFNAVRAEIRALDSALPVGRVRTFQEAIEAQTVQPRFTMALFGLFAAVGLILAAAGLFSVLSYLVTRRTREIGVRMALGAQWGDVVTLVLKDGGRMVGLGILVGMAAAAGAARIVASQVDLFRVTFGDPVSFIVVILLLSLVALLACWLPARRAARVDPMEALRDL